MGPMLEDDAHRTRCVGLDTDAHGELLESAAAKLEKLVGPREGHHLLVAGAMEPADAPKDNLAFAAFAEDHIAAAQELLEKRSGLCHVGRRPVSEPAREITQGAKRGRDGHFPQRDVAQRSENVMR
jgi:hypothetical protein